MKKLIKIVALSFLLISCENTTTKTNEKADESEDVKQLKAIFEEEANRVSTKKEITNNSENEVKINFADLTMAIEYINVYWSRNGYGRHKTSEDGDIYKTTQDTAFFYLYPGEDIFEKSFHFKDFEFDEIEVYGQFEIKVGINSERGIEVPFCVLENWIGYTSPWIKFKVNEKDLKFPTMEEKTNDEIIFTIDELKRAVKRNCGRDWFNEIKNIESLDKLPLKTSFFTTKYIYKIKARNSKTKQTIEKFIVFYLPSSC